jgi:hypothetical protein
MCEYEELKSRRKATMKGRNSNLPGAASASLWVSYFKMWRTAANRSVRQSAATAG